MEAEGKSLCGDVYRGNSPHDPRQILAPLPGASNRKGHLALAWWHYEGNAFVGELVDGRTAFYNYGLKIQVAGKALDPDAEENEKVFAYSNHLVRDRQVYTSAVTVWEPGKRIYLLRPEDCDYSNAAGTEKLVYHHGYSEAQWKTSGMPGPYRPTLEFLPVPGRKWRVLTDGRDGCGFGAPSMYRVFKPLGQMCSMEVGEELLGMKNRQWIRKHKMGWEIKAGPAAGKINSDNGFSVKRAKKIQADLKSNELGWVEQVTQFDDKMELHGVEAKWYDNRKWATVFDRLMVWGGPLAMILMGKGLNPDLMGLFRVQAGGFRNALRPYLTTVLRGYFGKEVKVTWSDRCFTNPRLALDMMKFLATKGPLSDTTALSSSGFDADEEGALKDKEFKDPAHRHRPLYDPAHDRTQPGGDPGGHPPGTKNTR